MSVALMHAEFQKYNIFRQPNWRSQRVAYLTSGPDKKTPSKRDDKFVKRAKTFVDKYKQANTTTLERLYWDNPGLFYAYQIHEQATENPPPAMQIEARLLAGQTFEEIAQVMATLPDTIRWYEALYFDVVNYLDNRDWIVGQVIVPAINRTRWIELPKFKGRKRRDDEDEEDENANEKHLVRNWEFSQPLLDGSLKLLGYFGGPAVIDFLLHGMESGKKLQGMSDLSNWLDGHWSSIIRRRSIQASLTFEINKENVMQLFETHHRIMELERSADAQNAQRSSVEKNILGLINEIPWRHGTKFDDSYAKTPRAKYDKGAIELRDDELYVVADGTDPTRDWPKALPAPRTRAETVNAKDEVTLQ